MKHLPIYNPDFKRYLADFEQFIVTKGYSKGMISMYPSCIREFLFFIESKGKDDIKEVAAVDIIAYHEYLSQRPNQRRDGGLSDTMIKHHLCSMRTFFDYLLDVNVLESSPARLPKFNFSHYKERNILTLEEIKQLYTVCETLRDRVILSLAYGCGLRRSE